jgi:multiple sugar transport system substrate-binding protein
MPLAYSEGSILINEDGTTDCAGPGWVKTVDHWRKVVHEWKFLPQDLALAHTDETQSIFISGKGVFYIQPSHRLGFTRGKSGLDNKIQYGPIPAFKDNTTAPVAIFGWILVMPKGAKHPESAVKFIDHFISPEMQAHLAEKATYTPVRKSAVDFPWFQTDDAADVKNFIKMASDNPLEPLILPEHANELFTMIGAAIEKVIINPNSVKPQEALQEVADEYNRKYAK